MLDPRRQLLKAIRIFISGGGSRTTSSFLWESMRSGGFYQRYNKKLPNCRYTVRRFPALVCQQDTTIPSGDERRLRGVTTNSGNFDVCRHHNRDSTRGKRGLTDGNCGRPSQGDINAEVLYLQRQWRCSEVFGCGHTTKVYYYDLFEASGTNTFSVVTAHSPFHSAVAYSDHCIVLTARLVMNELVCRGSFPRRVSMHLLIPFV